MIDSLSSHQRQHIAAAAVHLQRHVVNCIGPMLQLLCHICMSCHVVLEVSHCALAGDGTESATLTVLSATLATSSGHLHITIEPGGGRRFEVECDVAFMLRNTVCAAGPHFRPGQATFKANGPGRVLGQTTCMYRLLPSFQVTNVISQNLIVKKYNYSSNGA